MNSDDIAIWPCGTWAYVDELEYYAWKSDDYEVIPAGSEEYRNFLESL